MFRSSNATSEQHSLRTVEIAAFAALKASLVLQFALPGRLAGRCHSSIRDERVKIVAFSVGQLSAKLSLSATAKFAEALSTKSAQ